MRTEVFMIPGHCSMKAFGAMKRLRIWCQWIIAYQKQKTDYEYSYKEAQRLSIEMIGAHAKAWASRSWHSEFDDRACCNMLITLKTL